MFYTYSLEWYDEANEDNTMEYGLVQADDYSEAAAKIAKDYGEDCILSLDIIALDEDGNTLSTSAELSNMILKEHRYE